jgi:hypothetical protein
MHKLNWIHAHRYPHNRLALWLAAATLLLQCSSLRADAIAQRSYWLGYMSSWWLNPNRAIWFDTHYDKESFGVLRGGLTTVLKSGWPVTGGYAYVVTNPDLERKEHRPWGQIVFPLRLNSNWRFSQRIRGDLRIQQSVDDGQIVSGWDSTFRARFQSTFTYQLRPRRYGKPIIQFGDELLFNVASSSLPRGLDQNRASLMVGIERDQFTVRVGYMNRFIPSKTGSLDVVEHALLLWFTQSIDIGGGRQRESPEFGTP